jgi:hypothetical protein
MTNYFEAYYNKYTELKSALEASGKLSDQVYLKSIINSESHKNLNNLFMSGLGMGTLYLRMGAVLMIAEKIDPSAGEQDVFFLKTIADKLIHKLPSDGEWKDIWSAYLKNDKKSQWYNIIKSSPVIPGSNGSIYEKFVTLRNDIVHQEIIIKPDSTDAEIDEISNGLKILDGMAGFNVVFNGSTITEDSGNVYFNFNDSNKCVLISPFVQLNLEKHKEEIGILPYLFQGKYYEGSRFINTEGGVTTERKDEAVEGAFIRIKEDINRFNGDKAFDFEEKINNYNEWCIGREHEVNTILEWINHKDTNKNVLPVFAPAGLGKGTLIAQIIEKLKGEIPVMFHFCGSGSANNLHSVLYHFILQGNKMPGMDGVSIWNTKDPAIRSMLQRLPSQYPDVVGFFQKLIHENYLPQGKYKDKPLVIIIDGLDEAAVADNSKRISDWFYTYDEKGEQKEKWQSPNHVKWIFTYRQTSKENKEGFQFEYREFETLDSSILQPLKGLTKEAVKKGLQEAFKTFQPALTEEFIKTIIKKSAVK